jgi:hypothetical protein
MGIQWNARNIKVNFLEILVEASLLSLIFSSPSKGSSRWFNSLGRKID